MAFEEEKEYDASLKKVRKTCRAFFYALRTLYILALIVWVALLLVCIFSVLFPEPFFQSGSVTVLTLGQVAVFGVLSVFLIRNAMLIFRDMHRGESPFAITQSKRIRVIAYLIFIQAILESVFSTALTTLFVNEDFALAYQVSNPTEPSLFVNIGALVVAVLFYCLSIAFEYGALLQRDKDTFI